MSAGEALGIGVIGVGAIGSLHAEHIATRVPGARPAAIADANADAAAAVAAALRVSSVYADYRQLLQDPAVQAVVVAAPRVLHSQIICEAAAAGRHVFCEKPSAVSLEEIDEAEAAAQTAGVVLQIGFNRRFDATYRKARETLASGAIGEPRIIHITSRDPAEAGAHRITAEDLFMETAVHDFDMAGFLSRSEITEVHVLATSGNRVHEVEHCVTALRFASGAVGTIDNSLRSVPGYDQRLEVLATDGAVRTDNETADRAYTVDAKGTHGPPPLPFFRERYAASYVEEMRAFVECVRTGTAPLPGSAEARAAVRLALAALRSYREGRPVAVSEITL